MLSLVHFLVLDPIATLFKIISHLDDTERTAFTCISDRLYRAWYFHGNKKKITVKLHKYSLSVEIPPTYPLTTESSSSSVIQIMMVTVKRGSLIKINSVLLLLVHFSKHQSSKTGSHNNRMAQEEVIQIWIDIRYKRKIKSGAKDIWAQDNIGCTLDLHLFMGLLWN
ncbi:hypothetical protein BDB01DRAFT_840276 [Pilobolus umbonatus]|nr:hypothetical protein BDB01DRAFT_840276 [Pilobolus umbonatus]